MAADLVYYYLPKEYAVSVVVLSHLYAAFLGIVTLDFINHLPFDWRLVRSEGWRTPVKAIMRIAYFNCRVFPVIALSLSLAFSTTDVGRTTECSRYLSIVQWFLVPLLNSASLVFIIRTISLYGSKRSVTYPIIVAWVVTLAISIAALPFWGTAHYVPGTGFCTYDAQRNYRPRVVINMIYKGCSISLEAIILLLTLHRLMEHGISGIWRRGKPIGLTPLPRVLISQGFIYFVMVILVDIIFLALYFSTPSDNPGLQVAGSALVFSIQPLMATRLYRTVGKASNTRHVAAIQRSSLSATPSSAETVAASASSFKRQSQGPCSCDSDASLLAAASYDDGRFVQRDRNCSRRNSRTPLSPRSPVLPMHAIARRSAPSGIRRFGDDKEPSFARRLSNPSNAERNSSRNTGFFVSTDTVSELSLEDAAADALFGAGRSATPQESGSYWSQLATYSANQPASLVETPDLPDHFTHMS